MEKMRKQRFDNNTKYSKPRKVIKPQKNRNRKGIKEQNWHFVEKMLLNIEGFSGNQLEL